MDKAYVHKGFQKSGMRYINIIRKPTQNNLLFKEEL